MRYVPAATIFPSGWTATSLAAKPSVQELKPASRARAASTVAEAVLRLGGGGEGLDGGQAEQGDAEQAAQWAHEDSSWLMPG